jgi:hypothetical protein
MKIQFCLLLVALNSCGQGQNIKTRNNLFDQFTTQHIESRDSLFILYTVKEWAQQNWNVWTDYSKMYEMSNDQVDYFIGNTFYSPDKQKVFIWLGKKMPNAPTNTKYSDNPEANKLCPNGAEIVYSMTSIIGMREDVNQTWKLYPFNVQQAYCYPSKEETINFMVNYYFKEMKSHQMYRMIQSGIRKGHLELETYGYNLQDRNFWTDCWLFQKDTVGSYNLYPFQIEKYNYVSDMCTQKCAKPYETPIINYPEEILKLYSKQ